MDDLPIRQISLVEFRQALEKSLIDIATALGAAHDKEGVFGGIKLETAESGLAVWFEKGVADRAAGDETFTLVGIEVRQGLGPLEVNFLSVFVVEAVGATGHSVRIEHSGGDMHGRGDL